MGLENYPLYVDLVFTAMQYRLHEAPDAEVLELLGTHAATPLARTLRRSWLDVLARQNRWPEFLAHYRAAEAGEDQRCEHARALYAVGDAAGADAASRALWLSGSSRPDACDPVFDAWARTGHPTREERWQRAALAARAGNRGLARYAARPLGASAARLLDAWVKLRHTPADVAELLAVAGPAQWRSEAIAHLLERLAYRDSGAAAAVWPRLAPVLTEADHAASLRALALAHVLDGTPSAPDWLARVSVDAMPPRLTAWAAVDALRRGRWALALARIARLPEGRDALSRNSERWRYWRARAELALGNIDTAEGELRALAVERSYYGFLAADVLGQPYRFNAAPAPDKAARDALRRSGPVARALELHALDRNGAAWRAWRAFVRSAEPATAQTAAAVAAELGWHPEAIATATQARAWDLLSVRFPTPYAEPARSAVDEAAIPLWWLYGIVRQESAFRADARSGAGAVGLAQLLPRTARAVARKANLRWRGTRSLLQPDTNLTLGARYLRSLLDRFDGDLAAATAAYNAGPSRAARWRGRAPGLDGDLWVETVPFDETRAYLRHVTFNAVVYAHLADLEPPRLSTLLEPPRAWQASEPRDR